MNNKKGATTTSSCPFFIEIERVDESRGYGGDLPGTHGLPALSLNGDCWVKRPIVFGIVSVVGGRIQIGLHLLFEVL